MIQKAARVFATCVFMLVFFMLLWIWLDIDGVEPVESRTSQKCSELYRNLPANIKSQYDDSQDFINSCVN